MQKAAEWMLKKQNRRKGDWSVKVPNAEPGGWYFEHRNEFYPDVDDTAMVLMALREPAQGREDVAAACQRAQRWMLAMQNRDGGWGGAGGAKVLPVRGGRGDAA